MNRTLRLAAFCLACLSVVTALRADESLAPLRYNHPGLVVDLGVGLWAWPVPCDADGDGDYDLIVSCPDKPSNGIWLFENLDGDTATHKFPVFAPGRKLSSTVHYVMPSYVPGGMRVLSPGTEYTSFLTSGLSEKQTLPIPANFYKPRWETNKGPRVRHNQWRYVDFNGDDLLDLVVAVEDWSHYGWDDAWNSEGTWTAGPLHGFVFIFINEGTSAAPQYAEPFQLTADGEPLDVRGCPSPNFEDFDADGDLDLICGEFIDGFTYFENVGTRTKPAYVAGWNMSNTDGGPLVMDLEMIVPIAFDWDRDGDIDLIVGDEDGRVAFVENSGQFDSERHPLFIAPRYFQQQADELKCGALATPWASDWDGDGDQDLIVGNTAGYIEFFENLSGPGVEKPCWNAPQRLSAGGKIFRVMAGTNGSIQGPAESKWGYTTLSVGDWNHDTLPDIILNSIWGKVEWLQNIGTRTTPRLAEPQPIEVAWPNATPKPTWTWWHPQDGSLVTQWRTTPVVVDWNDDGLNDLIVLDQEGYLAFFERSRQGDETILLPPQRIFSGDNVSATDSQHRSRESKGGLLQLNTGRAGGSGRRKICVADWDGDGQRDILVNSVNANLLRGQGFDNGLWHFEDVGPVVERSIQGHTTSPCVVDFNNDGIDDFLGGAEDGRLYYLRNPRSQ